MIRAPSSVLNPTLDPKMIADELARDPAVARSEWLAEWRDDLSTFINRAMVEAAVDFDVAVRPPVSGVRYKAFCDPSGGIADSFTCCIAHVEGELVVLDCLVEVPAPFNPASATGDIAKVLKAYGLSEVTGDKYAQGWVTDAFGKHGIRYIHSARDRSAIYGDALPLFTSGRAVLLDNPRLVAQFAALERRASPTGRGDRIDHPRGGKDDCANSAAGALTLFRSQAECGILAFYREAVEGASAPPPVEVLEEFVLMQAPLAISHAQGRTGRHYLCWPEQGRIQVDPLDVPGFRAAGFTEI